MQTQNIIGKIANKPPKSIKSNKAIGHIKGYAVNSHKFYAGGSDLS